MGAARSKTVNLKNGNQSSPTITGNAGGNVTPPGGLGFPPLPNPFLNDFAFSQMNQALSPFNPLNNLPPPPLNPSLNPLAVPPGLNGLNPLAVAAVAAINMNNGLGPNPLTQMNPMTPPPMSLSPLGAGMNPALNPMATLNTMANMNALNQMNQTLNGMPPLCNSPNNQMGMISSPGMSPNQSQVFASNLAESASQLNNSLNNSAFMNSFSSGNLSPIGSSPMPKQITLPQPFPQIQPFPQPFAQPVPMKVPVPVPFEVRWLFLFNYFKLKLYFIF